MATNAEQDRDDDKRDDKRDDKDEGGGGGSREPHLVEDDQRDDKPPEPHPLVVGLALALGKDEVKRAIERATTAARAAGPAGALGYGGAPAVNPLVRPTRFLSADDLGDFGVAPADAKLFRSFSGYFGGAIKDPLQRPKLRWQVLFLDLHLQHWLIVESKDILYFDRVRDDTAACGLRDYLWVGEDALIGRGGAANSADAVVRSGAFSRAGDLALSLPGDTRGRRRGLMVDAETPFPSCGRYSR